MAFFGCRDLDLIWNYDFVAFSKRISSVLNSFILEETGYSIENVLLHEPKAGILKPAFTTKVVG